MLPNWSAAITTVPVPVIVSWLPLIEAGPERTLKTTALPDAPPVALSAIGATPYSTTEGGGVNVIACVAWFTVSVTDEVAVV